jgi:hypothetical protein
MFDIASVMLAQAPRIVLSDLISSDKSSYVQMYREAGATAGPCQVRLLDGETQN